MTNKLDRAKQQDYREFMAIRNEEEALAFWSARVPDPVGKPYFTPMDYRWRTATVATDLFESHDRHWRSYARFFDLFVATKDRSDETFEAIADMVVTQKIKKTDPLDDWVTSRYDNLGRSYLLPDPFSYSREESPESWEEDTNLSNIEKNEAIRDYEVLYYWQEVHPAGEPANDGRRHCILVDRVTHQEAPLLPGQEPFPR